MRIFLSFAALYVLSATFKLKILNTKKRRGGRCLNILLRFFLNLTNKSKVFNILKIWIFRPFFNSWSKHKAYFWNINNICKIILFFLKLLPRAIVYY